MLSAPARTQGTLALGGRDPVALCDGTDIAGVNDLAAEHFLYSYRFADADRRARFLADPERYCIQLGGGCARMGPLSGKGSPERWLVHDGRIYIFASDQCRAAFEKAPERFLPPAVEPVAGSEDAQRRGNDAVVRAIARLGGATRLQAVRAVRMQRHFETKTAEGVSKDSWRQTVAGMRVRRDQSWGAYRFTDVADGDDGFGAGSADVPEPMHRSGAQELRREALCEPLWLLRGHGTAGFRAAHVGTDTIGGRAVDLVRLGTADVAATLAIAQDDGEVLQLRRRCRGPKLWFADETLTYRDFEVLSGLRLARTVERAFDGGEAAAQTFEIEVDPELPADYFAPPKR